MKPRVFIGSSTESLDIAYAIQENLDYAAETTVWTQSIFELSNYTLDSLLVALSKFDFGIFVLGQDDIVRMREKEYSTARDNVVFELGLFISKLGKERNFLVTPRGTNDFHLPTDLLGLTAATFESGRQDANINAALGPTCHKIKKVMQNLGSIKRIVQPNSVELSLKVHEHGRLPLDYQVKFLETAKSNIFAIGTSLRSFVGYFDQRPSREFKEPIVNILRRGVNLTFFLLDPNHAITQQYVKLRGEPRLIDQTRQSLDLLENLTKEFRELKLSGKFEVCLYTHFPFGFIMLIDPDEDNGRAIFFHYLPSTKRADSPYFEVYKSTNPTFFQTYCSIVRDLSQTSRKQFSSVEENGTSK